MPRVIALYVRVSSKKQDTRSQEPDIERWAAAFADLPVKWYRDTMTGRTMDRPGWKRLEDDMHTGMIAKIVVWRLDRLGRTARGSPTCSRSSNGSVLVSSRYGIRWTCRRQQDG